mgnify:CR=1 FL=1
MGSSAINIYLSFMIRCLDIFHRQVRKGDAKYAK